MDQTLLSYCEQVKTYMLDEYPDKYALVFTDDAETEEGVTLLHAIVSRCLVHGFVSGMSVPVCCHRACEVVAHRTRRRRS